MPTLAAVEEHIEEHGHLPGVPSAKSMQTDGLSLGDSHTLLLQKVEELTLYMISQQKRIEELEKQLSSEKID